MKHTKQHALLMVVCLGAIGITVLLLVDFEAGQPPPSGNSYSAEATSYDKQLRNTRPHEQMVVDGQSVPATDSCPSEKTELFLEQTQLQILQRLLSNYCQARRSAPPDERKRLWHEIVDLARRNPDLILFFAEKGQSVELRYLALNIVSYLCKEGLKLPEAVLVVMRIIEELDYLKDSPYVVSEAIEIARLLKAREISPVIGRLLRRNDVPLVVLSEAFSFVRECPDESCVEPLIWRWENLREAGSETLWALASIGGRTVALYLIDFILQDNDETRASRAATWLQVAARLEDCVDDFKTAVLSAPLARRDRVHMLISAMGAIQRPEVVDFLVPLAKVDTAYAFQVIQALGKNHSEKSFCALLDIAKTHTDMGVRTSAISSLRELPLEVQDYDALRILYSSTNNEYEKLAAATVLAAHKTRLGGEPEVRHELVLLATSNIQSGDNEVTTFLGVEVLRSLASYDSEALAALLAMCNPNNTEFVAAGESLMDTLSRLRDTNDQVNSAFWQLLGNPATNAEAKLAGLGAIREVRGDERERLARLLDDSQPAEVVNRVLGMLSSDTGEVDERVVALIQTFAGRTTSPELRQSATQALKTIELTKTRVEQMSK